MTWKEVMSKALETQVAQPLPGVPLDGRYARYTGNNDVKIPIASVQQPVEQGDGGSVRVITAPDRKQGGVAKAVRNVFSLFDKNGRKNRVRQVRTVTIETREKAREKRIKRRKQRARASRRLRNSDSRR